MPVDNACLLKQSIASVSAQSYQNFELILIDDCSTRADTISVLGEAEKYVWVKLLRTPDKLGMSRAANLGIENCQGEWIAFLNQDDLIHPEALALFVRTLHGDTEHDVYFTDEAILDGYDGIIGEIKKSEPSMDLLLSLNAVGQLFLIRAHSLRKLGNLNPAFDGAQHYDLMIRGMEQGHSFCHLPYVLYGRRHQVEQASPWVCKEKNREANMAPQACLSAKAAIESYLCRQGIAANVSAEACGCFRVKYKLAERPLVSIIIPFKDEVAHLKKLFQTIGITAYDNIEIYLINNRSEKKETFDYLEQLKEKTSLPLRLVDFEEPFNYSRLHNQIVSKISNEILLFLNNDVAFLHPDWLDALLEHIQRPKVGAVGARLLTAKGCLQHGGIFCRPSVKYCASNIELDQGYYTKVQREVSAVSAACMLSRKSIFEAVGGFDEVHFPIGFSDVDLCLRMRQGGYKIIYTPYAELYHFEGGTRTAQKEDYEKFTLFKRYMGKSLMADGTYPLERY